MSRTARLILSGLILGAALVPVYWPLWRVVDAPVGKGTWLLVIASACANVVVIVYHYAIPAHPKFLMVPWRRWVLRTHIASGTVELIAGLGAIFAGSPACAVVQAVAALAFHVPSALLQTPTVFGSRAVMVPSYLLCIVTHAVAATMLLRHPGSLYWAVATFLVFNVYVWCRVYYYLFDWARLFEGQRYSISILAAGATMIPAVFGSAGFLVLAGFVGASVLLVRFLVAESPGEYADFVRERARDAMIDRDVAGILASAAAASESDSAARRFFDELDADHDGTLSPGELRLALATWGVPASSIAAALAKITAQEPIDFERFRNQVWSVSALRHKVVRLSGARAAASPRDRAELVFRQLDLDGDGFLDAHELELLLVEWGLPPGESRRYVEAVGAPRGGRIGFDDFLREMKPVWKYAYYDVLQAEDATRNPEMIGRSLSAIMDSRRTVALRRRLKEDLAARVPFLAGATEEMVGDLAASMVEETFAPGQVVFAEGSPGDKFYVVASGLARVSVAGETISDLGPGGCVGEGALLADAPRAATLTALEPTTLHALSRASFEYLTQKYPRVRKQLEALHRDRQTQHIKRSMRTGLLRNLPFLHGASPSLLEELASCLVSERFRSGDSILLEGEPGDRLLLVEDGAVGLTSGGRHVADLGPGSCLGEGALLTDSPRAATAVALDDSRLLSLSRRDFLAIVERHPGMRDALATLHRQRRARLEASTGSAQS